MKAHTDTNMKRVPRPARHHPSKPNTAAPKPDGAPATHPRGLSSDVTRIFLSKTSGVKNCTFWFCYHEGIMEPSHLQIAFLRMFCGGSFFFVLLVFLCVRACVLGYF